MGDDAGGLRRARALRRAGGVGDDRRRRRRARRCASATRSRRRSTAARVRRAGTASRPVSERTRPPTRSPCAEDAPGGERGGLGGGDRLHVEDGAEEHRLALVDEDQRRAVALLAGDADVRGAGAGGDLPVDGADVVAGEVGADLLELEAAAADARRRGGRRARCRPAGGAGSRSRARAPRARRGARGRRGCAGRGGHRRLRRRRRASGGRRARRRRRGPGAGGLVGEARRGGGARRGRWPGCRPGETKSWPCSQAWARPQRSRARPARGLAPSSICAAEVGGVLVRVARRVDEVDDVGLDRLGDVQRGDLAAGGEDVVEGDRRRPAASAASPCSGFGGERGLLLGADEAEDAESRRRGRGSRRGPSSGSGRSGPRAAGRCLPARSGSGWP